MSRIEAEKSVKRYIRKLQAEKFPFSAVYLFGSFAKNTFHKWSDIDVAVVSKEINQDSEEGRKKLFHFTTGIDSRIEPHGFSPKDFKEDWRPMVHEIKTTGIRIK